VPAPVKNRISAPGCGAFFAKQGAWDETDPSAIAAVRGREREPGLIHHTEQGHSAPLASMGAAGLSVAVRAGAFAGHPADQAHSPPASALPHLK